MIGLDGVLILIGGKQRVLRFTWRALLSLSGEWGAGFEKRISDALRTANVGDLAVIIEHGASIPRAEVIDASPDIFPLIDAIETAWNWAYLGLESAKLFAEQKRKDREIEEKLAKAQGRPPPKKWSRFLSSLGFAMPLKTR